MTDITKYKTITVPISDWKTVEKMKILFLKEIVLASVIFIRWTKRIDFLIFCGFIIKKIEYFMSEE